MKFAASIAVTAVASAVFVLGVSHPYHNWDMVAYVAAAHYQDGLRGEPLLARTYTDVRNEVDPRVFRQLSKGNDYRRGVYGNAAALEEQIPFYSIRVIYVEAIRGLGVLGVSYPRATYLIGAFFAALSAVILGIICLRANVSVYVLPLIVLVTDYPQLAALSSPDSLAMFGSLLAILACMSGSAWAYVLAAILPALRTDSVILSAMLTLVMFYRGQRLRASVALAAALVTYFAVSVSQHAYGWLTLLNFSLVEREVFPSKIVPSNDLRDYLVLYARAAWGFLGSRHCLFYLVSGCLVAFFRRAVCTRESYAAELLAIPVAFTVLHLALYPSYEDRFLVLPASLILVWIVASLRGISARLVPTAPS